MNSAIEKRIELLELLVSPESINPAITISKDDPKNSVIGGYLESLNELKRISNENKDIASFLSKYSKLQETLQNESYSGLMEQAEIKEIVESSISELELLVSQLQAIQQLKDSIEIPLDNLQDAKKELELLVNTREIIDLEARFLNQMFQYNEFINKVSELFVNYHLILSKSKE